MRRLRSSLAAVAASCCLSFGALTGCQRTADTNIAPPSVPPVVTAVRQAEMDRGSITPSPAGGASARATDNSGPPVSSPIKFTPDSPKGLSTHRFEIRDRDGKPIITDRQIVAYDWKTHRLTLEPRAKVQPPPKEGDSIVLGIPFAVAADGVVCYTGVFTSSQSSVSQAVPVINVDPLEAAEGSTQIELGYPTEQFFRGADPRGDKRIHAALTALGKLKE